MGKRPKPDHGIYSAPYRDGGAEYWPTSPRTGRMVSQATAEAEFAQSFHGIGTEDHEPGGLWDHDEEAKMRAAAGCRKPTAPERYDARPMHALASRESHEWTDRQQEVYVLFWTGKLSYGQIARQLGLSKKRVENIVLELRAKLRRE